MTVTLFWPFQSSHSKSESTRLSDVLPVPPKNPTIDHYKSRLLPPSARVNPGQRIREGRPVRPWHLWKYGVVAISKTIEVSLAVVTHHVLGPPRPSWSIEETLLVTLMRNAAHHSHLVNLQAVRFIMNLGGMVPLPSDAIVTPVTFRVRRRNLPGILAKFDNEETGTRELSGEWVVGRKTWQRLQADWKASRAEDPHNFPHTQKEQVIMYLHGGAYYLSSAAAQRLLSIPLSKYADARVFALDYRLAPETQFPGPLHDAVTCYLRLINELHIPPENITLAGDSAGGGLTLALLLYLRDHHFPLPAGAILMSPWVDLTMSCASWESNAPYDVTPIPDQSDSMNPVALYLGTHQMEEYLTHPYASPLFGDLKGLPPMLIQAGNAEVLRDEITLFAHKAKLAGVNVRYELYEDAFHVFQTYPFAKSSRRAFVAIRDFLTELPKIQRTSPKVLDGRVESGLEGEIDSEHVTMVRGDGVETASGMKQVQKELQDEEEPTDSESDAEQDDASSSSQAGLPSWGKTESWTSPFGALEPEEETDDSDVDQPVPAPPVPRRRRADTLPHSYGLRRIHSAMSIILPEHQTLKHRHHKRTLSNQSRRTDIRTLDFKSSIVVPPRPSLRRNSISHPDISILVDQCNSNTSRL